MDLTPVTATETSQSLVAQNVFTRNHVVVCIGLVGSVVQRSKLRRQFAKDVGVKRLKLEFVTRKSSIHCPQLYFMLLTNCV